MLKLLARLAILEASNDARKCLKSSLHCNDALTQRFARTLSPANLSFCFLERIGVGPIGMGRCVSHVG